MNRLVMRLSCKLLGHKWNGCKCKRCGFIREHDWRGCKCSQCGEKRNKEHDWYGLNCRKCGKTRVVRQRATVQYKKVSISKRMYKLKVEWIKN